MHVRRTLALSAALAVLATGGTATAAPHLTYHGGPVMHAAGVYLVNYDSTVPAEYTSSDPGFLAAMAAHAGSVDNVWAVTAEYPDTTAPAANGISYLGQVTIAPAAGRDGLTITEANISDEIAAQIAAGHLPAPTGDGMTTIYAINMPHNKHLSLFGVPDAVCGFHFDRKGPGPTIIMAVTGDVSAGPLAAGCGADSATANHQSIMTHEIIESITDPMVFELNVAWYDDVYGEISDICALGGSAQNGANYGFTVQKQWSNALAQCVATEAGHFSPPTVALDPLPAPVAGQRASFSAKASSTNQAAASTHQVGPGIAALDWAFGDGGADSGGGPTHVYAGPGPFTVGVTARDAVGFTAAASAGLTVASGPAPARATPAVGGAPPSSVSAPKPAPAADALPIITVGRSPELTISGGRLVFDTGRSAACPAGSGPCRVQVTVRASLPNRRAARSALARVLATKALTIAPGHSRRIVVKLGRGARGLVHRGRLAVAVTFSGQRGASTAAPVRFAARMAVPRRG